MRPPAKFVRVYNPKSSILMHFTQFLCNFLLLIFFPVPQFFIFFLIIFIPTFDPKSSGIPHVLRARIRTGTPSCITSTISTCSSRHEVFKCLWSRRIYIARLLSLVFHGKVFPFKKKKLFQYFGSKLTNCGLKSRWVPSILALK